MYCVSYQGNQKGNMGELQDTFQEGLLRDCEGVWGIFEGVFEACWNTEENVQQKFHFRIKLIFSSHGYSMN